MKDIFQGTFHIADNFFFFQVVELIKNGTFLKSLLERKITIMNKRSNKISFDIFRLMMIIQFLFQFMIGFFNHHQSIIV